jgi:hypothetical protein
MPIFCYLHGNQIPYVMERSLLSRYDASILSVSSPIMISCLSTRKLAVLVLVQVNDVPQILIS